MDAALGSGAQCSRGHLCPLSATPGSTRVQGSPSSAARKATLTAGAWLASIPLLSLLSTVIGQ